MVLCAVLQNVAFNAAFRAVIFSTNAVAALPLNTFDCFCADHIILGIVKKQRPTSQFCKNTREQLVILKEKIEGANTPIGITYVGFQPLTGNN